MRGLLAMLCLVAAMGTTARGQDLTGQWTGSSTDNESDIRHKIVLNIAAGDSLFSGVIHWYYPEIQFFRNFIVRGQFHSRDSTVSLREDSAGMGWRADGRPGTERVRTPAKGVLVDRADGADGADTVQDENGGGPYILYYKHTGHKEILEGRQRIGQRIIHIRLEKKPPPFLPIPPVTIHKKKDSTATQADHTDPMLNRQTPLVMAIPVPVVLDSVKVELYDNGEIDGDSVSLYLNDRLIVSHVRLLAEAKVVWVKLDKSHPVNRLVLTAENLGALPPNTALMQVTVRGKKYSIFLSTDFKRNAMVEFFLQE